MLWKINGKPARFLEPCRFKKASQKYLQGSENLAGHKTDCLFLTFNIRTSI
tara:strand:- start:9279 stop:9431 length:153 start_codon:yes stop_codon:yes gene_type:complete